jgi:hypothetical protein
MVENDAKRRGLTFLGGGPFEDLEGYYLPKVRNNYKGMFLT